MRKKINHCLVRGFMEMVVFRISGTFKKEIEKTMSAKSEFIEYKVKMNLIHEAFFTIFALLVTFIKIGIIIYGWKTKAISIGAIIALITLVDNAYTPVAIFNVLFVQYKLDKVAFNRFKSFLDSPEDKTVIFIAHRLNSIRSFKHIIAFKGGDIVAEGNFDELMDKSDYYIA